jgi:hypothetical protein
MVDVDLKRQVDLAGRARLESIADVAQDLPVGVRMLEIWPRGEHGVVLFWVDCEADRWGSDTPICISYIGGWSSWRPTSAGPTTRCR